MSRCRRELERAHPSHGKCFNTHLLFCIAYVGLAECYPPCASPQVWLGGRNDGDTLPVRTVAGAWWRARRL
ncbi:hypothetical protein IW261DRAFT_1506268 [Armillaria novae-zelandiae]|uniref:Uncharacterized protein n=1 Tax=Armillaria novae-zelandiae TaxID=153914 RepID=A0AA39U853_9AGAR|nr:hypothetical protein IW261DRAFT_1506268 [Armillaria novae-zelandiae]